MPDLPKVRQEFEADGRGYSAELRRMAGDADKFGDRNDKAALAARKMGLAAKEAADKAARAMSAAGEAAENLAMGLITADEAAQAEAKALREIERAAIRAAEAELAASRAAEKAAAVRAIAGIKAGKVTQQQRSEIERLTAAFPDLRKQADTAMAGFTDGVKAAESDASMLARFGIPGLVAGIALLPTAAGAAGGALTVGLGGAFTAVGLKAAASSAAGKAAIDDLTSHAKSEMAQLSKPFEVTWHNIDLAAHEAFSSIEPAAEGMFGKLAASSSLFARRTGASFHELNPALDSLGGAFDAVMDKLGTKMPGILHNVSAGFEAVFNSIEKNPGAITEVADDLSILTRAGGDVTGALIGARDKVDWLLSSMGLPNSHAITNFASAMGWSTNSTKEFATATQGAATAAMQAVPPEQQLTNVLANQKSTADDLKNALDRLTSANMSLDQATIAQARAAQAAAQANDHRRKVSLEEKSALLDLASADHKVLVDMKATGASSDAVTGKMSSLRAGFIATAEKMGYTAGQAKKLADRYGLLPAKKETKISAPGAQSAEAAAYRVANAVRSIPTRWNVTVTTRTVAGHPEHGATGGLYDGNRFKYAAGGEVSGLVSGPGTGTSDDVPGPWLSNGEFVVREKVTRDNTLALMALNRGMSWMQAAAFAPHEGFATGGKVKSSRWGGTHNTKGSDVWGGVHSVTSYTHTLTKAEKAAQARLALAKARPEYLAAIAAQQALERMRASMYGGLFRGGASPLGSAHGTVVQHVHNVTVHVAGSIRSDQELAQVMQKEFLRYRLSIQLPAGR